MKKIHPFIIILSFFLLITTIQSCDPGDFGDTNVNPNATTQPITAALLTNSLLSFGRTYIGGGGIYAQYFTESQYTDGSRYARQEFSFGYYSSTLYDLENIIIQNTNENTKAAALNHGSHNNQIAVARIVKVYFFSYLTDMLGDIPYFEALKGDPKPAYDSQELIYQDLFKELDEAVKQFDNGIPAKGDILFNGNIEAWKKFANSLRLMMALRLTKVAPDMGKAEVIAALAADKGVIENELENAFLDYPGGVFRNPYFNLYNGGRFIGLSDIFVGYLKEREDPRMFSYGSASIDNTDVIGIPYGVPREMAIEFITEHPDWALIFAPQFRQDNSPLPILTSADVYLARAEAAALGWTDENVTELYRQGIAASMQYWEVFEEAQFEKYISGPLVALNGTNDLEKIRFQRYLGFFPNGYWAWNIWRRTGVPDLQPTPYAVNASGQIPRRYVYWSREANLNPENYEAAVARLGEDTMDGRVWWDVQE